jgi:transcription initiation factor TFIID subunit 15
MGDIPSVDNMVSFRYVLLRIDLTFHRQPSAKFNSPKNFDTIATNTPFTISLQIRNMATGTFTNAANTYYAAPQQLSGGVIQGHSHVTVQKLASLDSPQPLNPKVFDFFKGLNGVAENGILTADVTKGLPAGVYRISSINSAGNHQEALGPVAQRGSFNDAIYVRIHLSY